MSYEVDVLAVGEESKSGDAIALRFGDLTDSTKQFVVVIDGGFQSSGEKLVERIISEYHTKYVDLVISTHPDSDHINGLSVVLEKLTVGELWMHTPWNISDDVKEIAEKRDPDTLLKSNNKIMKSLQAAYDLEQLAIKKDIKIVEPFEGTSAFDDTIHVLGPNLDYYYELAGQFDKNVNGTSSSLASFFAKIKETISELWHEDKLEDPAEDAVSARNNSSVIVLLRAGKNFLFFGDSGVPAIERAANYADSRTFNLSSNIHYMHVPHHGSKRNLGPTILDCIVGQKLPKGEKINKTAFISAAVDHPKHPSKRVKNALIRRGMNVSETCGKDHCFHSSDVPTRPGWGPIAFVEFCETYEEE